MPKINTTWLENETCLGNYRLHGSIGLPDVQYIARVGLDNRSQPEIITVRIELPRIEWANIDCPPLMFTCDLRSGEDHSLLPILAWMVNDNAIFHWQMVVTIYTTVE